MGHIDLRFMIDSQLCPSGCGYRIDGLAVAQASPSADILREIQLPNPGVCAGCAEIFVTIGGTLIKPDEEILKALRSNGAMWSAITRAQSAIRRVRRQAASESN